MLRRKSIALLAGIAMGPLAALTLAACGDDAGSAGDQAASAGVTDALVDTDGRTLYGFNSHDGHDGDCQGDCASHWEPMVSNGGATVAGADPSMLGTVARPDGVQQVSYNDHPLYRYDGDHGRGDHYGHCRYEYGGDWHALDGNGNWYDDGNCHSGEGDGD